MKTNTPEYKTLNPRGSLRYLNYKFGAQGTRYFNEEEIDGRIQHTFGFRHLQVWNPRNQEWIQLPDKFYVTNEDRELAINEFWARWRIYVNKRFNLDFLQIAYSQTIREI